MINTQAFLDNTFTIIDNVMNKEQENILKAADICAEAIAKGGVIQVFGTGHSLGFGNELGGRVGSLVPVHTITIGDFVSHGLYTYADFKDMDNIFERRPGIAGRFYELYEISDNDVFIIISNSGINGLVIDLADTARSKGQKVIVVTSLDHTLNSDSRHPSGKKLMDHGDVVIDNCGPMGDALLPTEDGGKIGAVSSITGIYIAQSLAIATVAKLQEKNVEVPVLRFEDSKENIEFNQYLLNKYAGRI